MTYEELTRRNADLQKLCNKLKIENFELKKRNAELAKQIRLHKKR